MTETRVNVVPPSTPRVYIDEAAGEVVSIFCNHEYRSRVSQEVIDAAIKSGKVEILRADGSLYTP